MNRSILKMKINSNSNNRSNDINYFNPRNMIIIPLLNNEILEYSSDGTILFGNSIFSSKDKLLF